MARGPRLQKITVSLLKPEVGRSEALRDRDDLVGHRVPGIDSEQDVLFVASNPPHPPGWKAYLAPHVTGPIDDVYTASASAVLLFEASGRLFAVTFGGGRHLLEPDAFVQDFGLRVVLNTVAPDQLKSVDAKTIDETTVHTRRDVSRDSSFAAFGLDVSRDLLRAVTGTPQDRTLAHRLTGADALGIQTRLQVPELPELAERLLVAYEAEHYKEHFDFIDYLRPEKRRDRVRELDAKLVDALVARDIDDVHLAAPQTLDWIDVAGFRFSSSDERVYELGNDPRVSAYLDTRDAATIDIDLLRHDRLLAISGDDQMMDSWPIYRCLVYQVELYGSLYVLSTGDWFRVDLEYRDKVEAEVNALPLLTGLPDADPGTDEEAYNVKAAQAIGALCLDKKLVYDGGPDKMEICDILTRGAGLIHVKHRGSSSTLSHLFAQGINSAERLLLDQDFRDQARAIAKREDPSYGDVLPASRPLPNDHEISFVVITRSTRGTPLTLPFFSVVSLRAAATRLRGYGFPVSVAAVLER
jgi:uncharacterized protein (TIGR04141 family)